MKILICMAFAFILILKGGDLLVESSVWFSNKTKIPSVVVGATLVALATTFPEISVSIISGVKGIESLAINTSLGSMVCNLALVLGFSFLISPTIIKKSSLISRVVFFIFSLAILLIVSLDKQITLFDAIILLIVFGLFILLNLKNTSSTTLENSLDIQSISWLKIITQFLISTFAIGFGANVLVSGIDELSLILNLNEGLLGVFIISVGTNIPEFVTTLTAIKLNNPDIAIGNIFGASIIDASLLIAITTLSSKNLTISLPLSLLFLTIFSLLLITLTIALPILKKEKTSRLQGFILILLFVIYSLFLYKIS